MVSNATLHHLPDSKAALLRLSEFVRPEGTLAIAGFVKMELLGRYLLVWRAPS